MKARYRFKKWRLTANPDVVGFTGKCTWCPQTSFTVPLPDEAQLWCLQHAGATGHKVYELATVQMFTATPDTQDHDGETKGKGDHARR
ncbi:hypothetical protein ACFYOD_35960 [Streptomyces sp. NPDC006703]|uniref:DUF7848 domain-containing protein n=1 Tax=Streptomyces sp. NPDC006703 TaxID=3364759 RepID=UPI003676ECEF